MHCFLLTGGAGVRPETEAGEPALCSQRIQRIQIRPNEIQPHLVGRLQRT